MTITLKLNENEIGSTEPFREISVYRTNTFNAIFDEYESQKNIKHKQLRYIYRGRLIKGTETPSSLRMKNGDTIKVIYSNSNNPINTINKSVKITLSLIDPNGIDHPFEIKIDRKIKGWLKNSCQILNLDYDSLAFFVNDKLIDVEKTPHQMKLSSSDKVYAKDRINVQNVDDNAIKCHEVQSKYYSPPTNTTPIANTSKNPVILNLNIKKPNNEIIHVQIDSTETFKHCFKPLLKKYNIKVTDYHFIYNNKSLNGNDTPNVLQMKEGDTIKMKKKNVQKHNDEDSHNSKSEDTQAFTCLLI
ncbi:hypothetical protein M9Y10_040854 [Tritrichomonas musculus]|uniref:Ubiquitin-like domain-containing protein n=1 Tax=Tritrichomonas musculus TaxID=1915356 RepID=A0ABR2K3A0_9EUKA